jgi:hypothetical protein
MFHPYMAQLLAAERRRDYLEAACAFRTPARQRRAYLRHRRPRLAGYQVRLGLRRPSQPAAEFGP